MALVQVNVPEPTSSEGTASPLVPESSAHVPLWQWALIIVSIILIIVFILWGRQFIQKQYGWGTWSKTQSSQCTSPSMSCAQPAKQWQYQTCEPNPLTRRGCLNYDGVQTYATRQKQVECTLQCQMSKWQIDVSTCTAPDPCVPVTTGGVMGSQTITYTCIPFDQTGINACTTGGLVNFNGGQYQEVKVYQPGDVVATTVPCMTTCPVTSTPKMTPTYSHVLDTHYRLSSTCLTNSDFDLKEGYELVERRPDLDDTDLPTITPEQIQQGQLPEDVLNWPYVKYDERAYSINLCRLIRTPHIYSLKMKLGWLSGLQTPNNCSTILKYKVWQHNPTEYLYDTPLTWSNRSELKVSLVLAHHRRLSDTDSLVQISVTIGQMFIGWLIIKHGLPYWSQAQVNYIGPGRTSDDIDLVRIRQHSSHITILNPDGSDIWLPSADAWLSGKNWRNGERVLFSGKIELI